MPMIDFTLPQGALGDDALDTLSRDLMRALLRAEGAPEAAGDRKDVAWFFVHELPPSRMYAGGRPLNGDAPVLRLDITVPEGALDAERKNGFVGEATELIVNAAGTDPSFVWVLFHELSEWGASGRALTIRQIAKAVMASGERVA
jgi:phenylpyruvate tautomerase PptA (4-oxalocrotonate tautomerase family)